MNTRFSYLGVLACLVLALPAVFAEVSGSSVGLRGISLPRGVYTLSVCWGNLTVEKSFEVSDGSPRDLVVDFPSRNIRAPMRVRLVSSTEGEVLSVDLTPTALGYEATCLNVSNVVRFTDPMRAIGVRELVSMVDALILWSPTGGRVVSVTVNDVKPPSATVGGNYVNISGFVVDRMVEIKVEFENKSVILATFSLGVEGLNVRADFKGPFESVQVDYNYTVRRMDWIIALPITTSEDSLELSREFGRIMASKGGRIEQLKPETSGVQTTSEASKASEGEGSIGVIKRLASEYRYELLTVGTLLILVGAVRKILPLVAFGAFIDGLTILMLVL